MKNLAASTAIALAIAAPAFSQTEMSDAFVESVETQALRASDLIGARLYVSENEVDPAAGQSTDWEDVGEIADIVVGSDGGVDVVIVDIGGFLGVGERSVAVNMDSLAFPSDGAAADEFFVVLQGDRAMLESAPEFDDEFEMGRAPGTTASGTVNTDLGNDAAAVPDNQGTGVTTQSAPGTDLANEAEPADTAEADVEPIVGDTNPVPADPEAGVADNTDSEAADTEAAEGAEAADVGMMAAPAMEVEGYETVANNELTTDDITGAQVYSVNDEAIGEIGELVMSADGTLADAVIDVGGFLGLGAKAVAIPFDQLQVMRGENDVRVYVDATEEQLTNMPDYEG